MELTLLNAGDQDYEKVDVDVNDTIRISIYDLGIFIGVVEAISKDYILLKNIISEKRIDSHSLRTFTGPTIFYNEEIYRISVIKKEEGAA